MSMKHNFIWTWLNSPDWEQAPEEWYEAKDFSNYDCYYDVILKGDYFTIYKSRSNLYFMVVKND